MLGTSHWFLGWLIFRSRRWRQYIPPKCLFLDSRLYSLSWKARALWVSLGLLRVKWKQGRKAQVKQKATIPPDDAAVLTMGLTIRSLTFGGSRYGASKMGLSACLSYSRAIETCLLASRLWTQPAGRRLAHRCGQADSRWATQDSLRHYGTRKFITVFTRDRHWTISWAR
jgi:hypothetical protein